MCNSPAKRAVFANALCSPEVALPASSLGSGCAGEVQRDQRTIGMLTLSPERSVTRRPSARLRKGEIEVVVEDPALNDEGDVGCD